jgi:hypothetical protein
MRLRAKVNLNLYSSNIAFGTPDPGQTLSELLNIGP